MLWKKCMYKMSLLMQFIIYEEHSEHFSKNF